MMDEAGLRRLAAATILDALQCARADALSASWLLADDGGWLFAAVAFGEELPLWKWRFKVWQLVRPYRPARLPPRAKGILARSGKRLRARSD